MISGYSDADWSQTLAYQLGPTDDWVDEQDPNNPENSAWGYKSLTVNGKRVIRFSKYGIRLNRLCDNYDSLENNTTETEIKSILAPF